MLRFEKDSTTSLREEGSKAKFGYSVYISNLCSSAGYHGSSDSGLKRIESATCSPSRPFFACSPCADNAETATPSTHPKEWCASGACTLCASESSEGRKAGMSGAKGMAEKTGNGNRLIDRAETTRMEWYANMTCIQRSFWG